MASLFDELVEVLEAENTEYEVLYNLSVEKTDYIARGEVSKLSELVEKEQGHIGKVSSLEKKRSVVASDIANVLNVPEKELTIRKLITLLKGQPDEQKKLDETYLKLRRTIDKISKVNDNNRRMIEESLEMIDFEINLAQSLRSAPETANYNKGAYGAVSSYQNTGFDAKQ